LQGSPTKEGWRPGLAAAPFAIQTDGLFFASTDIEDPAEFAAALGIPAGGALGQFSHEGTVHVEDLAVVDELRTPYRLNQWLKREVAAR
jgi:hypothetical protein